ncbi:AAA family ATPase [Flagellimonas marina]|uniref:ATP/GTP-binding protein n=1 Tax=Flagellimonas marina TaxID=1775168 RepID=A0ABV8PL41_9FLAO
MITSLSIKNFRGIKTLELEDLGKVNLLLGKNNTSKTSILEALFLLCAGGAPEIIYRIHQWRDLTLNEEDDLKFIFYNLNYNNKINIEAENSVNELNTRLEISPDESGKTSVSGDIKKDNITISDSTNYHDINSLNVKLVWKEKHNKTQSSTATIQHNGNKGFVFSNHKGKIPFINAVMVVSRIHYAPNLEKRLEKLIISKQIDEIVSILKTIDSRIRNISVLSGRMVYVDLGKENLVPLNLIGDGMRRLFNILLAIYDAENGIVIIDEIENGFHHTVLEKVWEAILSTSRKFNVQLFIATHDLEALKRLNSVLKIEKDDIHSYQKGVRSYTIRMLDDNLKSYKYDFKSFSTAIEENLEIR